MTMPVRATVRQGGVALGIVVWFIAGMSLLVAGIVSHARVDTRMAQLHTARARAAAAGDGAIQLMMADQLSGRAGADGRQSRPGARYRMGELEVTVTLTPAAGLIDLNGASGEILSALFQAGGGLGRAEAQTLADNVVKWRSAGGRRAAGGRFASIEDLVRVDGVSRTLLDAIADYVTAGVSTGRGTDWSVSPDDVLAAVAASDPGRFESVTRRRAERQAGVDGDGRGSQSGGLLLPVRADAVVRYGDESWLRRRWLVSGAEQGSRLPWHTVRIEPPRIKIN